MRDVSRYDERADATYQSPEVIIVVTAPVPRPGAVDLRVENPDGQSATLAGGFTFTPPPAPPKLIRCPRRADSRAAAPPST